MSAASRHSLDMIREPLAPFGLVVHGVVGLTAGEGPLIEGGRARCVVLIGNAGGSMWPAFSRWHADHPNVADPLDEWSKSVIAPLASSFGGAAFFPSDTPYQPFQRWAMRAMGVEPSPLGILVHREYGPWFGFRGAIALLEMLEAAEPAAAAHPCADCAQRPCTTRCPVAAVSERGFLVGPCRDHLATPAGQAGCMEDGCLARDACPVGRPYRYPEDQIRFHMRALGLPPVWVEVRPPSSS